MTMHCIGCLYCCVVAVSDCTASTLTTNVKLLPHSDALQAAMPSALPPAMTAAMQASCRGCPRHDAGIATVMTAALQAAVPASEHLRWVSLSITFNYGGCVTVIFHTQCVFRSFRLVGMSIAHRRNFAHFRFFPLIRLMNLTISTFSSTPLQMTENHTETGTLGVACPL